MESTAVTVGGGVEDVYGEDCATEDQLITLWTVSIARYFLQFWGLMILFGYCLLRDPRHNKGLAFTGKKRDAHYLRGLLPPVLLTQDLQIPMALMLMRCLYWRLLSMTAMNLSPGISYGPKLLREETILTREGDG